MTAQPDPWINGVAYQSGDIITANLPLTEHRWFERLLLRWFPKYFTPRRATFAVRYVDPIEADPRTFTLLEDLTALAQARLPKTHAEHLNRVQISATELEHLIWEALNEARQDGGRDTSLTPEAARLTWISSRAKVLLEHIREQRAFFEQHKEIKP